MSRSVSGTSYIHFTDEQKQRANSVDLEDFLRCKGEVLEKSGREKRLKSDKSVTVRGNEWFDHSKEVGGFSIDFVQKFYGLSFPDAVLELLGEQSSSLAPTFKSYVKKEEVAKPFVLPPKNKDMKRSLAYLSKHRGIDYAVLYFFAKQNLIYESNEPSVNGLKEYHNAIFVGCDEKGVARHAHKRSIYTMGSKFMQNIEGSNPKYSFHYLGGSNRLYVFEAPIDLLSFVSIHKNTDWQQHNYVALCGVSSQAIVQLLDINEKLNHVVLCLDNDKAGHRASESLRTLVVERNIACSRIVPEGKDFNEDLQAQRTISSEQEAVMVLK